MKYDINGEPELIQTRRGPSPNPHYQPGADSNQPAQEAGLSNLLKDLGSNSTPSNSITLTSGKDDGAIDVTRKDTINAANPNLGNKAKVSMPEQAQSPMLNGQQGGDVANGTPSTNPVKPPVANINQSQGEGQGPQSYTVAMNSEDDLALQNDPSFTEMDNEDGTITYTSNDTFSGGQSAPGTGNPLGPQVTEGVASPSTIQRPSGAVVNPNTGQVEAVPLNVPVAGPPTGAGTSEFDGPDQNTSYLDKVNSEDPLETADALEELAITEFEDANSNINTSEDAEENLNQVIDGKALGGSEVGVEEILAAKDEIDQAAETGDKGFMGSLMDSFKGVFKDGELTKALLLYAGSRIVGFSHKGSAKWAYGETLGKGGGEWKKGDNGSLFNSSTGEVRESANGNFSKAKYSTTSRPVMMSDGRLANYDTANNQYVYLDDQAAVSGDVSNKGYLTARDSKDTIKINKARRDKADEFDTSAAVIDQSIAITQGTDFDWSDKGLIGAATKGIRKAFGAENDVDLARNVQNQASVSQALTNKPPGAISNDEMKLLLGAVPNANANPQAYIQWAQTASKFLKAERDRKLFINDLMSRNAYVTEYQAAKQYDAQFSQGESSLAPVDNTSDQGTTSTRTADDFWGSS